MVKKEKDQILNNPLIKSSTVKQKKSITKGKSKYQLKPGFGKHQIGSQVYKSGDTFECEEHQVRGALDKLKRYDRDKRIWIEAKEELVERINQSEDEARYDSVNKTMPNEEKSKLMLKPGSGTETFTDTDQQTGKEIKRKLKPGDIFEFNPRKLTDDMLENLLEYDSVSKKWIDICKTEWDKFRKLKKTNEKQIADAIKNIIPIQKAARNLKITAEEIVNYGINGQIGIGKNVGGGKLYYFHVDDLSKILDSEKPIKFSELKPGYNECPCRYHGVPPAPIWTINLDFIVTINSLCITLDGLNSLEKILTPEEGKVIGHDKENKPENNVEESIEVDPARALLKYNNNKEKMEPKTIELFELLWEKKDEIVKRSSIFEILWPDYQETHDQLYPIDAAIEQQIIKLRDGLEKLGFKREIIKTYKKRKDSEGAYEFHGNITSYLKEPQQ